MKIKTKKGARRIRNQKVHTNIFTRVQSPINTYNIELGKVYNVWDVSYVDKHCGYGFNVKLEKTEGYCLSKGCAHINNNDWIILPNYK